MREKPQSFDRVLSSMCTVPHPGARRIAQEFLATNPGDPGTYPTVSELEDRAIAILGEITGLDAPMGYVTSGGTEANLQAVRLARNRKRRQLVESGSRGHSTDRPTVNVVISTSGHFSFNKASEMLDVERREVPTDEVGRVNVDGVRASVDEDTALVVGIAGTTDYGRVDPIPELASIASSVDALFHVDAAWGGFCLPFTDYEWNFDHASIDTMAIDPHKMGRAAVPAGGFLVRSEQLLEALAVETPYLETTAQVTLTGTRSGAGVASAVQAMEALWPNGYRKQFDRVQSTARWLARELDGRGFDVSVPTLPLVTVTLPCTVFDTLRQAGWRLSRTGTGETRIVCMPHVRRAMLESFLTDLDRIRRNLRVLNTWES